VDGDTISTTEYYYHHSFGRFLEDIYPVDTIFDRSNTPVWPSIQRTISWMRIGVVMHCCDCVVVLDVVT
jgi:hypothetical protein